MGLGKRIGEECKRKNMTLRQVAIKADVPYSTLYSAVNRDSDSMDFGTLKRISDALGIDWIEICNEPDFLAKVEKEYERLKTQLEEDEGITIIELPSECPSSNTACKPKNEERLLQHFRTLNADGQSVAVDRIEELAQIPKYQRKPSPQNASADANDKEPTEK